MSITLVLFGIANYQINTKMRMGALVLRMAMFHPVKNIMMRANSQKLTNRQKAIKPLNNLLAINVFL
ncbi:hypothetical protein A7P84_06080 [Eikenella corrodens]|nr:hypothetical protein A7P84_06025 [Eikenella corrodens]OAM19161.1 hypothetical protein A7P84_06080 [Eikenella corrodens]